MKQLNILKASHISLDNFNGNITFGLSLKGFRPTIYPKLLSGDLQPHPSLIFEEIENNEGMFYLWLG